MYVFENDKHLEANDRYIKILRLSYCILKKIYFSYFLISPSFVAKVQRMDFRRYDWNFFDAWCSTECLLFKLALHYYESGINLPYSGSQKLMVFA